VAHKLFSNNVNTRSAIASSNVADFPIGSPQSRAAARALLIRKNALSQEDEDSLTLCYATSYLGAGMYPCYSDLEATTIYRRGMELHELRYKKINLSHYNAHLDRSTRASIEFEYAFGREPNQDDILSFEQVQVTRGFGALQVVFGQLIDAWHRQIPDLMCPYKFDGDRLFRHLRKGACRPCHGGAAIDGGWHEAIDEGPEWNWRQVEQDLAKNSWPPPKLEEIPRIPAIVFLGIVDGAHQCRTSRSQGV
jgi:hypothetical protein